MVPTVLRRRVLPVVVLLVAVSLLSGMAWIVRGRSSASASPIVPVKQAIAVRVFEIRGSRQNQTRSLTGVIESRYVSELAFRVAGKIESRLVNVGDRVVAGDPLFKLELNDFRLQLESAEADLSSAVAMLKQATTDEERMRSLRTTSSVSADDYDKSLAARDVATARHTAAQRSLELARNRLSYTTLEASADGVVTAVMAERGQVVAEGRSVARLAQSDSLEIVVGLPEKYVAGLKVAAATVTFWSLPGVSVAAQLRELSPTSDLITRTYVARYSLLNAPPELQLGMSATLHLKMPKAEGEIAIPSGALVGRQEKFMQVHETLNQSPFVWRIVDDAGHIQAVPVEVTSYGDTEVYVRGQLSDGDRIVSAGAQKLDIGLTVQPWEELK